MNASDERTRDTLGRRLADAVQMRSVMGEMRPNLVVIDEVDGAMGGDGCSAAGAVSEILRVANDGVGVGGHGGKGKGKRGDGGRVLRRPIVCICNDLYAPSLRALREQVRNDRPTYPKPCFMMRAFLAAVSK